MKKPSALYDKIKDKTLREIFLTGCNTAAGGAAKITSAIRNGSKDIEKKVKTASALCDGFKDKKVLEAGCGSGGSMITRIRNSGAEEVIGMDLKAENRALYPNCRLESGDIRKTHYPDGYFDIIISYNTFEHIHDFDAAAQEMYRILKPGGSVYSSFGPIWSTSYGHHLWVGHLGKLYNYWNLILPPFCHLLMTPEALLEYCSNRYDPKLSSKVVEYVYNGASQNRIFYEDYENIIGSVKFDILFFKGYDLPELRRKYLPSISQETLDDLNQRFPKNRNFLYDGIELLLKKP